MTRTLRATPDPLRLTDVPPYQKAFSETRGKSIRPLHSYNFVLPWRRLLSIRRPKPSPWPDSWPCGYRLGTILLFVLLLAIWHGVFVMCGLYESKRLTTWRAEIWELLRATCLASILLLGLARMFHIFIVQPAFVPSVLGLLHFAHDFEPLGSALDSSESAAPRTRTPGSC